MNRILSQIKRLNVPDLTGDIYVYFYALHLSGKCCAKVGMSFVKLSDRIHNYLEKEHANQSKDYDSFRLIYAIKFPKRNLAKHTEAFLKAGFSDYPLDPNQPSSVEQFKLEKVWESIGDTVKLKKYPLGEVYVSPDPDADIDFILNKKHIYPPQDYIKRSVQRKVDTIDDSLQKINRLTKKDFMQIKGIGKTTADSLVKAQPFKNINDILSVDGIGKKRFSDILRYLESC